ncbi:2'-5' RNA ligase family protein [Marmoricola sp. URHA0025 HA25]
MLVHGAIIPPTPVLEAVADAVRSVPEPVEASAAPQSKGLLGRVARHRASAAPVEVAVAAPPVLEHVPVDVMRLPITGFGNLTTNDANRLVTVLKEAAAGWAAPSVRFAGGTALDFPDDWSVWAKVDGDVDALMTAARGVPQVVERLGYFLDRRQFRPMLSVATVTTATTGPYLEAVVAALDAFRGEEWIPAISLTTERFVNGRPETTVFERIELGS